MSDCESVASNLTIHTCLSSPVLGLSARCPVLAPGCSDCGVQSYPEISGLIVPRLLIWDIWGVFSGPAGKGIVSMKEELLLSRNWYTGKELLRQIRRYSPTEDDKETSKILLKEEEKNNNRKLIRQSFKREQQTRYVVIKSSVSDYQKTGEETGEQDDNVDRKQLQKRQEKKTGTEK